MCPVLHTVPCTLSIRLCSGEFEVMAFSRMYASWFGPKVAPFHTEETSAVGFSWFALTVRPVVGVHGEPTPPFARLKLSSTAVSGNVTGGGVTVTGTLAVSLPPRPSVTVRIAAKVPAVVY